MRSWMLPQPPSAKYKMSESTKVKTLNNFEKLGPVHSVEEALLIFQPFVVFVLKLLRFQKHKPSVLYTVSVKLMTEPQIVVSFCMIFLLLQTELKHLSHHRVLSLLNSKYSREGKKTMLRLLVKL